MKVDLSTSQGTTNLSGPVTVTATITPQQQAGSVTSVQFFVGNPNVVKATDTSAPYTYLWDTTTVPNGSQTLYAKAFYSPNKVVTDQLTVTVQNQAAPPPPPPPPPQDPPANTAAPAITPTGAVTEGMTLTCSTGTWTNSPTSYSYHWVRCDSSGANCVAIAGATTNKYVLVSADVTKTVRCSVIASNAAGPSASIDTAQTQVVGALSPAVPVNTAVPTVTGTASSGSTLASSTGSWTNSPTSYAYQWQRCSTSAAISYVGVASAAAASVSLPAGATTGDVAIVFAFRDGNATPPSLPSGWTALDSGGSATTNCSQITGYKVLGADTTTGTWTNATEVEVIVLRGQDTNQPIGNHATDVTNNSNFVDYGGIALTDTSGKSWVVGMAAHMNATNVNAIACAGMTTRAPSVNTMGIHTQANATDFAAGVGYSAALNSSVGAWRSSTIEVRAGQVTGSCSSISGATTSNYLLTSSDVGSTIRSRVTASNGSGAGTPADSATTAVITAAPPPPPPPPPPPSGTWPASFFTGPAGAANLLPPRQGVLFGAINHADDGNHLARLAAMESYIGRKLDIVHHFYQGTTLDVTFINGRIAAGYLPLISWFPNPSNGGQILRGDADSMIAAVGQQIAGLNGKIFLRPYWEFNGDWYAHSRDIDGSLLTHDEHKAMWRRTIDILRANGAFPKASVVWCAQEGHYHNGDTFNEDLAYPGDDYVDWVGSDAYNSYPQWCGTYGDEPSGSGWCSFKACNCHGAPHGQGVEENFRGRKPFMTGETGCKEASGFSKGQWFRNARDYMKTASGYNAWVYFDYNFVDGNWSWDTSTDSKAGFRDLAIDPYFKTRA